LRGHEVTFTNLQPELTAAFQPQSGGTAAGWSGVYLWCRQASAEGGGAIRGSQVFTAHDLLVVQVDADVAGMTYGSANIVNPPADLPCEQPCPPPGATTDAVRAVIRRWLGEPATPPHCVLCVPSKSIETWVLKAVFPEHREVVKADLECRRNPEGLLAQMPKGTRMAKSISAYRARFEAGNDLWPTVRAALSEAARFSDDFLNAASQFLPARGADA
jgi:hypothetical protein